MWRRSSVRGVVLCLGVLALAFIWFTLTPATLSLHPTGSFKENGDYPSQWSWLVDSQRYGSWSGSDANTGALVSWPFTVPEALVIAVAGSPSHSNEAVVLRRVDTAETTRLSFGPDPGASWRYYYLPMDQGWRGKRAQLVATDNGRGWGDWLGVASLRPARLDERILGKPVLTPWAYVGFIYLGLIGMAIATLLKRTRLPAIGPTFGLVCTVVIGIAFVTGWTNQDLWGWYAAWGRNALLYGPSSLYQASWPADYPPIIPSTLVVSAFFEALFRTSDPRLAPFFFKLVPLASLLVLPFLVRAALISVGAKPSANTFRVIVVCTAANPALVYLTTCWGQWDVFVVDLLLAAFIALIEERPALGAALYIASILAKPLPILALPVIAALALRSRRPWHIAAGSAFALLAVLPSTYPHGGLFGGYTWLLRHLEDATNIYPYVMMGAGTFPAIITGDGQIPDSVVRFGVPVHQIATAAFGLALIGLFGLAWRDRERLTASLGLWYLAASCMTLYWLAPRMHERYLTYAVVATIAWAFAANRRTATASAVILSAALFLQMVANWGVDLGWRQDVMATVLLFAPHFDYFVAYSILNIIGLGLLLFSRMFDLPQRRLRFASRIAA